MIENNIYIRRNEMDSVLTYLVDSSKDSVGELHKSLKKIFQTEHLFLFRDMDHSLMELLCSLNIEHGKDVILSALAPISYYKTIQSLGLNPIVLDVNIDSGVLVEEEITKNISDNTALIINVYDYNFSFLSEEFTTIPQINIFRSGIIANLDDELHYVRGQYNIISLENNALINSFGGSILICNSESSDYITSQINMRPTLTLQGLNASFLNSQLSDLKRYFSKQRYLIEIYKSSLLKSNYVTFDSGNFTSGNYFSVIVKKSLKDIQKYCKNNGVDSMRGFNDSIIRNTKLKASNAKSLSNRTLLLPLSLSLKKESIELISKILSTLP